MNATHKQSGHVLHLCPSLQRRALGSLQPDAARSHGTRPPGPSPGPGEGQNVSTATALTSRVPQQGLGDPGASLQVAVQTFPPRTRTALAALPPATPSFPFCCAAPPRAPGTERQRRQPGTRGGAGGLASSTGLSFFTCELRRATVPASWAAV